MIQNLCIPQFSISECFLASVLRCSCGCWGSSSALARQHTMLTLSQFHGSSPVFSAVLSIPLHFLYFRLLPVFLSPLLRCGVLWRQPWNTASFPQLFPRETKMKRYYQPFLSAATPLTVNADKRLQYHLWPFTGLSEHTRTHHSYYWQCLWISTICSGVEEFNDIQCRFNFSAPQPGCQVHHLSFYSKKKGRFECP